MVMDDEPGTLVKHTNKVTGFVGAKNAQRQYLSRMFRRS
jgi:transcription antitermination factor NusG